MKLISIIFILFLLCLNVTFADDFTSNFSSEHSLPYPVVYAISAYDAPVKDCTVLIKNEYTNKESLENCQQCNCLIDLSNLGYHNNDYISSEICIYNGTFCKNVTFVVEGTEKDIKVDFSPDVCSPKYKIYMEFEARDGSNIDKKSNANDILNLKEDDKLVLKTIYVKKSNDCKFEDWKLNFETTLPNGLKGYPFGISSIDIPPLIENQSFSLRFNYLFFKNINNNYYYASNYSIFIDNTFSGNYLEESGVQPLTDVGTWEIKTWISRKYFSDYFNQHKDYQSVLIKNKNNELTYYFKVKDKFEHMNNDNNIKSFWSTFFLNLVTIALAIITIIISTKQYFQGTKQYKQGIKDKKEYDEKIQLDLLKSIQTQMRCIHRDILVHKEDLNKKPTKIPFSDMTTINSGYYLTRISSDIKGKETDLLKETIILVENNVSEINSLLHFAREFKSSKSDNNRINPFVEKIKRDNFSTYAKLEKLLGYLNKDIKKIVLGNH